MSEIDFENCYYEVKSELTELEKEFIKVNNYAECLYQSLNEHIDLIYSFDDEIKLNKLKVDSSFRDLNDINGVIDKLIKNNFKNEEIVDVLKTNYYDIYNEISILIKLRTNHG